MEDLIVNYCGETKQELADAVHYFFEELRIRDYIFSAVRFPHDLKILVSS